MKIYHVTQSEVAGYDTFSDFVVIANNEEEAKNWHPYNMSLKDAHDEYSWPATTENIQVELIGWANDTFKTTTVICSSFHAG